MSTDRPVDRNARADRILDTAKDLLLRWGYRRISIAEVAKRADVGKGTIYLHWRTRDELFLAVGAREAAQMVESVIAAMRRDPYQVALHRYLRRYFLEAMSRPVLRALFTQDEETLDRLVSSPARGALQHDKLLASGDYLDALNANGLLRKGIEPIELSYTLPAVAFGFFGIEPLLDPEHRPTLAQQADRLAAVVRRSFEPTTAPAKWRYAAAVPAAIASFDQLARGFRHASYGETDD